MTVPTAMARVPLPPRGSTFPIPIVRFPWELDPTRKAPSSPSPAASSSSAPGRTPAPRCTFSLAQRCGAPRGSLLELTERFLDQHLARDRAASPHTLRAYRQTLDLFLGFLEHHGVNLTATGEDRVLPPSTLQGFLDDLEGPRGNRAATRNARLAALRSFARFVELDDPLAADALRPVLRLPYRAVPAAPPARLDPEAFVRFLNTLSDPSPAGTRDACLLQLLYDTGARIGEILALRWNEVALEESGSVLLRGSRDRRRTCPLAPGTRDRLRRWRDQSQGAPDRHVFLNAAGTPLTREGAAYLLRARYLEARRVDPTLPDIRIHPHTLRQSRTTDLRHAGLRPRDILERLGLARLPRLKVPGPSPIGERPLPASPISRTQR